MTELDVRQIPPSERHDRIHDEFAELEPGETLTIVNDHEPTPLYHEMAAEVPAFDADGYAVEREEASRFVAEFPKVGPESGPEQVRLADLDGEPHAAAFPGREPKTVRLSLDAGQSVPEHTHPDRTVLFHALTGAFEVRLDGEMHAVEAGEIVRFDGETAIEPTATEDATALVVLALKPDE
ncbi:DUF2249 domain-containing protein [Halorubrum lacusprofundi]|jgi:uncharacterized protein (DUF2249 family)|uniref:Cupin 2 conserved barrel domain protein n=1 Tax=Halorubrum lacusprofundi (strain ATCC 49239 / DSM 5036 / JCM 8891 / ACAM 34) TaxID=416348 RepID=B9LMG6_HALLT|nr:DUF2249 domain-containing protein [Halorubrum lacusprofundi]ACM56554.1 Cupin 2 conserved barrel domain protein [Halorubrum lacusprofundi ATCC 49239]MCG1005179.1 DUF2249 domain-containing protein [Halorubrum lacusprofundi]